MPPGSTDIPDLVFVPDVSVRSTTPWVSVPVVAVHAVDHRGCEAALRDGATECVTARTSAGTMAAVVERALARQDALIRSGFSLIDAEQRIADSTDLIEVMTSGGPIGSRLPDVLRLLVSATGREASLLLRIEDDEAVALHSYPDGIAEPGSRRPLHRTVTGAMTRRGGGVDAVRGHPWVGRAIAGHLASPVALPNGRLGLLEVLSSAGGDRIEPGETDRRLVSSVAAWLGVEFVRIHRSEALSALEGIDLGTGLANRNALVDRLRRSINRTKRQSEYRFVMMSITVRMPESLGIDPPSKADIVARKVAEILRQSVRPKDGIARIDEGEFVVVLEDADIALAERVADRILPGLSEPIDIDGETITMDATVAITMGADEGPDVELRVAAEDPFYLARRAGSFE